MKDWVKFSQILLILSLISILIGDWFVYVYAPIENTLGLPQKIFYFHVSFAWWALFAFFLVFLFSLLYLIKKKSFYHMVSACCAEVGVVYASLVLCTGIIWAKASWNTYWTWDPRLTTTLIMWFLYVLYLTMLNIGLSVEKKYILTSVFGVIAFLDVPLVFWSARMFRSIHPAIFAAKGGGMPKEMIYTLIVNLIAYGMLFFGFIFYRISQVYIRYKVYNLIEEKFTSN